MKCPVIQDLPYLDLQQLPALTDNYLPILLVNHVSQSWNLYFGVFSTGLFIQILKVLEIGQNRLSEVFEGISGMLKT